MRNSNINISLPDINKSTYSFKPDESTNTIFYGFRGILGVGDKIISEILEKRPFSSFEDFMNYRNVAPGTVYCKQDKQLYL